jgi:ATP-binding cassette, subfamily F, member 3
VAHQAADAGYLLLITHDIYLAEACADRLWLVYHGRARQYDEDLEDYRKLVAAADRPGEESVAPTRGRCRRARGAKPKASKYTLQRKLEAAEAEIEQAQAALADIGAARPSRRCSRAIARGESLLKERAHAATALARAESAWLEASEALEGAR